jgi:hypothetical protein
MLENLIRSAIDSGCQSITLVSVRLVDTDGKRGWQASVQRGKANNFGINIASDPIEALRVALGAPKLSSEEPVQIIDPEPVKKMTYWYHPESESVWTHLGNFSPEMDASADVMLSTEITEEECYKFLAMQAAEKDKTVPIIDPEMDDLL